MKEEKEKKKKTQQSVILQIDLKQKASVLPKEIEYYSYTCSMFILQNRTDISWAIIELLMSDAIFALTITDSI